MEHLLGDTELEEDDEEKEEEDKPVNYFRLFKYSSRLDKLLLFLGSITAVGAGFIFIAMMIMIGDVVDVFVENIITQNPAKNEDDVIKITGQAADTLLSKTTQFCVYYTSAGTIFFVLNVIMVTFFSISAANQAFRIKCLFMKAILRQNIGWFDTNQTGDFATQITGNLMRIQDGIGVSVCISIFLLSQLIFSLASAIYYGWKLTLAMMCLIVLILVLTIVISKFQADASAKEKTTYSIASAVAEEVLSAIRTVVAFGGENREIARYNSYVAKTRIQGIKRSLITSIGASLMSSSFFLCCALTFWYGVTLVVEGRNTGYAEYKASNLVIVCMNIMSCSQCVDQISPHLEAFNIARSAAAKLFRIIERIPPINSSSDKGRRPLSIVGNITLNNIFFSYPSRPNVEVLQDFSLKVKSGETVALVGLSGCGKSAVIQLIQRFYDVDEGCVQIDDNDVRDLNISWLRGNIGVVGQEPVLFSTTIAENIRYGNNMATQMEIERAARIANVHDFITNLPEGYNTFVENGGAQLSGGQKQRIAIARAIIKEPKILLLDEATSALDRESEYMVKKALDKARQNKTTIIVAHQLSTIRKADRIVTIEDGKVKEIGTHDELMTIQGSYYQLYTKQSNGNSNILNMEINSNTSDAELYRSDEWMNSMDYCGTQYLCSPSGANDNLKNVADDDMKTSGIRLLKFSLPEMPYITFGCISAMIVGVCPLVYGILFGDILQLLSQESDVILAEITYYSLSFIGISIITGVFTFLQTLMFAVAGEGMTLRFRVKAFSSMIYQDMSWFDLPQNSVGALCSRLSSDTSDVQAAGGIRISIALQALSTLVSTIVIGFYFNWELGLVALSSLPLVLLITHFENVITKKGILTNKSAVDDASKIAIEAMVNIKTVASLNQEEVFYTQFKTALMLPLKKARTNSLVRGIVCGFARVISPFQYAATLYYGSLHVAKTGMPYGDLIKVLEAIAVGTDMISQAVVFSPDYYKAKLAAARLFQLLDQKPKIDVHSEKRDILENWSGNVEFKNLSFRYPCRSKTEILKDFNLNIESGKTVALVGSSGCGKSTCIQLIERFYEASEGELNIGSKSIDSLRVSSLRSQIGLVSQEPVLFSESIAENISYGLDTQTICAEEVIAAARSANIHEFISALPQGYATLLGEKGTQLSGGQKQRIALARALVRQPKLLLLDEATSALDAENEKIVQAALVKACRGMTCVTIAHRLATIQNADVIAVIQEGRVVEKGGHDELLELRGHYYNLYNAQDTRN